MQHALDHLSIDVIVGVHKKDGPAHDLAAILKDPEGWVDEHPSFATDGALGRAKYYASVGGPGVVAAFLFESLRG